jgi:hypothetical protein
MEATSLRPPPANCTTSGTRALATTAAMTPPIMTGDRLAWIRWTMVIISGPGRLSAASAVTDP